MNRILNALDKTERIIFELRSLYLEYGYQRYKMDIFEDYDLYGRNSGFLVSDRLITFTDGNGKLKALKPDVTLSVILNSRDLQDGVEKFCYNESVYRMDADGVFREIDQTGIECIGRVDEACLEEVLTLAAKSLQQLSPDYVLSLSELTILSFLIGRASGSTDASVKTETEKAYLTALQRRSRDGMKAAAQAANAGEKDENMLIALIGLPQDNKKALAILKDLLESQEENGTEDKAEALKAFRRLEQTLSALEKAGYATELDFSIPGDTRYYNGIVFKGFLEGVPESVLSGGQYDGLMRSMGMKANAAGFAVYLDRLP